MQIQTKTNKSGVVCRLSRRHNQARQKYTRAAGSSSMDSTDKTRVKHILADLQFTQIQTDPYMIIELDNTYRFHDTITYAMRDMMQDVKIRHPDILAFKDGKAVIFEIDGKYHKDFDNDYDYDSVQIPYVKINKQYLKEIDMPWSTWVLMELQRQNVV